MASGTPVSFTLPLAKPILTLDDEQCDIDGTSNSSLLKKVSKTHTELCHAPNSEYGPGSVNSCIPQSVILGSLLEHLCSLYEKDPERSKTLFTSICKQLEKVKIVSPVAYLEEYASIRSQYKTSFYDVIQSVILTLDSQLFLPSNYENKTALKNVLVKSKPAIPVHEVFNLKKSRYENEFEELSEIGHGAFGKVFQARHKIDNQNYAVKKIRFRDVNADEEPQQVKKVMREVQSLASLQHPHVVRYYNAWMEHCVSGMFSDDDASPEKPHTSNKKVSTSTIATSNSHLSNHIVHSSERLHDSSTSSNFSWGVLEDNHSEENGNINKFWKIGDTDDDLDSTSSVSHCKNAGFVENDFGVHFEEVSNSPPSDVIFTHGVQQKTNMKRVQSVILTTNLHHSRFLRTKYSGKRHQVIRSQSVSNMQNFRTARDILSNTSFGKSPFTSQSTEIVLFIQMQICESSLQIWLIDRNTALESRINPVSQIDELQSFDIFHQILSALDYIHGKGILHRDLKPRNILLNHKRPHVLLGDFGLSRSALPRQSSEVMTPKADIFRSFNDVDDDDEHTSGIGTTVYAAPEQLCQENYDFKADMYSTGIIFFELTWPLKTAHERSDLIDKLRQGDIPGDYVKRWKSVADVLQSLTSHEPEKRPSANDLLNHTLFYSEHGRLIADQKDEILSLKKELSDLQHVVQNYRSKFGINPDCEL